jgi:hypothetical protein
MAKLLSPEEFEAEFGGGQWAEAPQADRGNLFGSGVDRTQAALLGIAEEYGVPFAEEARRRNQFEADETARRYYQTNPDRVQSFRDIRSLGDVGSYAADLGVQSAPALVGLGGAALLGGAPGALAMGTALGKGEILQAQREEAGETNLLSATAGGLAYGAADALTGLGGMVVRRSLGTGIRSLDEAGVRYLDSIGGLRGAAARTGAAAAKGGVVEGVGETLQQGAVIGGRMAVNPDLEFFDPENVSELQESFVGGALLGGVIKGGLGGWRRTRLERDEQLNLMDDTPSTAPVAPEAGAITPVTEPDVEVPVTDGETVVEEEKAVDEASTAEEVTAANQSTRTVVDPRRQILRDTYGILPTQSALNLVNEIEAEGLPLDSPILTDVINFAAEKPMDSKRLQKALLMLDAAIIDSRKAPSVSPTTPIRAPAPVAPAQAAAPVVPVDGQAPAVSARRVAAAPVAPVTQAVTPAVPVVEPATPAERVVQRRRVVTPTAPAQAYVAPESQVVEPTAPTTELSTEDQAAIEELTSGTREAGTVLREDATPEQVGELDNKELEDRIIAKVFEKSKDPARDAEIMQAYLTLLRESPDGETPALRQTLGDKYGIKDPTVRKIGNTNRLVAAGRALGYTPFETRSLFRIPDTSKRAPKEKGADEQTATAAEDTGIRQAVAAAGVETTEGESAGFGRDDSTTWRLASKRAGAGDVANADAEQRANVVQSILEAQDDLRASIEEFEAQGQLELVEQAMSQIEALDNDLTTALSDYQAYLEGQKGKRRAVQESSAEGVDARDQAEDGQEVGEGDAQGRQAPAEGQRFGKDTNVRKRTYSVQELTDEIKEFIRADIPGRKLRIVQNVDELINSKDPAVQAVGQAIKDEGAYGVATNGVAYLVADRIERGQARAKFMHEVGAHLGLENLLPKAKFDALVAQIRKWADSDADTDEVTLANRALLRVINAKTPEADQDSELLAYFVEESIQGGIDPTAGDLTKGPLGEWFRTLWAAFKTAVRALGFKPDSLTAVDVVNLAYGAARLEIAGTWHGTAADFRKFDHRFMGTGEGAQAFGWGTYLAQRAGIAKGYWSADVRRKKQATEGKVSFGGQAYSRADLRAEQRKLNNLSDAESNRLAPQFSTLLDVVRDGLAETKRTLQKKVSDSESMLFDIAVQTAARYNVKIDAEKEYSRIRAEVLRDSFNAQKLAWLNANEAEITVPTGAEGSPEGTLMRVDTAVPEDEMLDWDVELRQQPQVLARIEAGLPQELREAVEDESNLDLAEMTGEDFYRALDFIERRNGQVSEQFDVADYNKRLANKPAKQVVSTFIDEKLGVNGLKFLDAKSRSTEVKAYAVRANKAKRYLAELESDQYEHLNPDDTPMTPEQRQTAIENTKAEIKSFEDGIADELRKNPQTRNIVIFNDKNLFRVVSAVGADRQRMKFGKNAMPTAPTTSTVEKNINKLLPPVARQPARNTLSSINRFGRKALDYVVFTSDLINRASDAGIKSAKQFGDLLAARATKAREMERDVERIADLYTLVPEADRGTGPGSVNQFIFDSTREGKWGYDTATRKADPEMKVRFDNLSPESQNLVRAMFDYGDKTLARKKKTVLDTTASEYDALIAAAKVAGDTAAEARLTNEKANTLKRFKSLFAIREGIPYAPIKRTGNHVVVAKSTEYVAAEEAGDTAKLEKLQADGDHYHVSFTDTAAQARDLRQQLEAQGAFNTVDDFEREGNMDALYGGESMLKALTAMRSKADAQVDGGDKSAAKLQSIISQLYLEALAEGSARKSEMKRRGVAGEVDMLSSFALQGRADANFLASLEYNSQVQDTLQKMRKERNVGGDRRRKSELFNELAKRYEGSLETPNNPWLDKLTRASSVYFLATSPAYYMQNLLQPFMMSIPAMAGRHDYTKATAELTKAYAQLGDVVKSVKLGNQLQQQWDFSKVPADVREVIKTLADRGRIDIGLDTELGEFRIEGEGAFSARWNKVDKGLRTMVQKAEAINRLSTAMAAYRLELAKTKSPEAALDYADRILQETHGDYSRFNAPRAFNTPVGKVALQFRKFQLIQLTFYAKLINDAYTGKDRAMALKTLGYALSHTAVLAGAMGLPGYAAISWALSSILGSDDEEFDLTDELRKAIGDEDLANMILRGAPTVAGMDISGKVGAGTMLSILPFSNADLTTRSGQLEAAGAVFTGAAGGMIVRGLDGAQLMLSGDFYKGFELLMPKGISDAMKAYRIADEGMTRRNGDVILPPDEVDSLDAVWQALGIAPVKQTVVYEKRQRFQDMTSNFTDRTTRIKNNYVAAMRKGDTAAAAEAREAWKKLQDAKVKNGLKRSPLSDLLKAPREQQKRERNTRDGIQFNRSTQRAAEEIAER